MYVADEAHARRVLANATGTDLSTIPWPTRAVEGWAFLHVDHPGPVPFGFHTKVVSGRGATGRVELGETADQAIRRIDASDGA